MTSPGQRTRRLPKYRRGDSITARYLTDVSESINELHAAQQAPRQNNAGGVAGEAPDEVWQEIARTTETVRVFDPNDEDVWVDVDRIVTATFRRPDGFTVMLKFAE